MKKKYFIFILLIGFVLNSFTQDYTPMLELGKIWNMQHYDNLIPPNNYDFNITLDNLVTVNGTEYFEASNGNLFREDLINKKIYRLENNTEELILNFDLVIGDDLISPLIFIDETTHSIEITEIGLATFYGIPNLKYYETDCGEKIIEGIGVETIGLFGISTNCSTVDLDEGDFLINMNNNSDYIPMAVENANWVVTRFDGSTEPPFDDDVIFGYTIKGDTLINSIDYKKVYFNHLGNTSSFINRELFGAIRDDIPNKKVYGIQFTSPDPNVYCNCDNVCDTEFLMYDFAMEIGDSYEDQCLMSDVFILEEMSEQELYGENRMVQGMFENIYDLGFGVVVEGIGGAKGLFEVNGSVIGPGGQNLTDFCIGTDQECLSQFLLSNDDYFIKNNINLFYNQTEKQLELTNNSNNLEIEIYSVLGKKVVAKTINTSLDVTQLQKGVYFYSLSKGNAIKKGKVLIY